MRSKTDIMLNMNNLIRVSIPLDTIHWTNASVETVWVEVDKRTYDIYHSGKAGGFYYGILRNDSVFFPKTFCFGARVMFTLNTEGLPTMILSTYPFEKELQQPNAVETGDESYDLSGDVEKKIQAFCHVILESGIWYDPIMAKLFPSGEIPEALIKDYLFARFQDVAWVNLPCEYKKYFERTHDVSFVSYVENYVTKEVFCEWYCNHEDDLVNGRYLRK